MERWSYKPEVEGLSPSLGTKGKDEGRRMKDERPGPPRPDQSRSFEFRVIARSNSKLETWNSELILGL